VTTTVSGPGVFFESIGGVTFALSPAEAPAGNLSRGMMPLNNGSELSSDAEEYDMNGSLGRLCDTVMKRLAGVWVAVLARESASSVQITVSAARLCIRDSSPVTRSS
jgi:hypothetical protein